MGQISFSTAASKRLYHSSQGSSENTEGNSARMLPGVRGVCCVSVRISHS